MKRILNLAVFVLGLNHSIAEANDISELIDPSKRIEVSYKDEGSKSLEDIGIGLYYKLKESLESYWIRDIHRHCTDFASGDGLPFLSPKFGNKFRLYGILEDDGMFNYGVIVKTHLAKVSLGSNTKNRDMKIGFISSPF